MIAQLFFFSATSWKTSTRIMLMTSKKQKKVWSFVKESKSYKFWNISWGHPKINVIFYKISITCFKQVIEINNFVLIDSMEWFIELLASYWVQNIWKPWFHFTTNSKQEGEAKNLPCVWKSPEDRSHIFLLRQKVGRYMFGVFYKKQPRKHSKMAFYFKNLHNRSPKT